MKSLSRRTILACLASGLVMPPRFALAAAVVFYRNPGCDCCHKWAEAMKAAEFAISLEDSDDLAAYQTKLGVPEALHGCHAGVIDGYAISGHVPPEDIKRLLAERPQGAGLAVPGMPMGSPGMEMGDEKEAFEVLLFQADGSTGVFARHG